MISVSKPATVMSGPSVRIDWLSITFRKPLHQVLELLASELCLYVGPQPGELFRCLEHGGNGYSTQMAGWNGIRVFFTPGRDDIHVRIPGDACRFTYCWRLMALCAQGKVTRVDVALDGVKGDDGKDLSPYWVYWNFKHHPERQRTWANRDTAKFFEQSDGQGFTLGSRESERFLRCYDQHGFTRMELEIKGKRAELVGQLLADKVEGELPRLIVGLIRDYVDFIEPGSNKSRAPLQRWWAELVEEWDRIKVSIPEKVKTLAEKEDWCRRQMSPTLSLLYEASGGSLDWFFSLIDEGGQRRTAKHELVLSQYYAECCDPLTGEVPYVDTPWGVRMAAAPF